ncbi:substance-K receptor-like [Stylophora pistillata]|nr:substance-K receptor-like [Stylophora pistillata]
MMNNSTSGGRTSGSNLEVSLTMQVVLTLLAAAIATFDLIGNAIVIHVTRSRTPMRTTTDLLIANLAAADLMMLPVIVYLVNFFYNQFDWFGGVMGQVTCRLAISLQALSVVSQVYSILAISVDRCCVIFFPLKKVFDKTCIKWLILVIWLIAVAFAIPQFMVATVKTKRKRHSCYPSWEKSGMSTSHYTLVFMAFGYLIPLVTIATLYLVTTVRLWKSAAPGHHSKLAIDRIRATRRKPTKMLIGIVIVFALCWFPLHAAEILRRFAREVYWSRIPFEVNIVLPWFGIANSAINPFIYPMFCEKYRYEFRRILSFQSIRRSTRTKSGLTVMTGQPKFNGETCKPDGIIAKYSKNGCSLRKFRTIYITSI